MRFNTLGHPVGHISLAQNEKSTSDFHSTDTNQVISADFKFLDEKSTEVFHFKIGTGWQGARRAFGASSPLRPAAGGASFRRRCQPRGILMEVPPPRKSRLGGSGAPLREALGKGLPRGGRHPPLGSPDTFARKWKRLLHWSI